MNIIISVVIGIISSLATVASVVPLYAGDIMSVLTAVAGVTIISNIWGLINLVPGISLTVRRLHDIGKQWYWILFALIPIAGAIILIVLMATEQKHAPENEFASLPQV